MTVSLFIELNRARLDPTFRRFLEVDRNASVYFPKFRNSCSYDYMFSNRLGFYQRCLMVENVSFSVVGRMFEDRVV